MSRHVHEEQFGRGTVEANGSPYSRAFWCVSYSREMRSGLLILDFKEGKL